MIPLDPFTQGRRVVPPPTLELRGPGDPDNFRVKVGRYGDRWYHDPMTACPIAPTWEGVVPSVSTVKKASGSDWSFVALKRVASAVDTAQYARLDLMPYEHRYEALKAINKLGLGSAARRGTNVHLMAEARLYGQPCPVNDGEPGAEYRSSVDQFFDHYQPTLVAAEFVCINRELNGTGYGGTADAIIEIDGKRYLVDWKSRGADSEHGAYPEEGAQVSAYAMADYIIVEGKGGPERQRVPELAGGLIVSIKPDGCRVYPIDFADGCTHWAALHAWWVARQSERKAVGRQWVQRKIVEGTVDVLRRAEATALSPPSPGPDTAPESPTGGTATPAPPSPVVDTPQPQPQVDRLAIVDARAQLATTPDQGADLSADDFAPLWATISADYDTLDPACRSWVGELSNKATRQHLCFHPQRVRTERSYHIAKALVALCIAGCDRDEVLRALCALVVGDVALFPGVAPGHTLGSLSATEAERLGTLVDAFVADRLIADWDADGVYRLREQAA